MKKIMKYTLVLLAGLSISLSCSKIDEKNDVMNPHGEDVATSVEGKQITICAKLPDAVTRVEYALNETGSKPKLTLTWESDDVLVVSNASGSVELGNPTIDETGKTATFTGVLPEGGAPYKVSVKHAGSNMGDTQTQASDGDLTHLEYAAMAENVTEEDFDDLVLSQTTGVLGLIAKIPTDVSARVKAVIFQTENKLFNGSNTLTVKLTNAGAGTDNILYVYANIAAGAIPAGTEMFIRFKVGDGANDYYTRYQKFDSAVSLANGALNGLKLNCSHIDRYAGKDDDGTSAAPYLIADKYQLMAVNGLSESAKKCFKLIDHIDLVNEIWTSLSLPAGINFNGNNKIIRHLNGPLFVDLQGEVSNLTIEDASINGGSGITGILANTVITAPAIINNVDITGTTTASYSSSISSTGYAGGLIGQVDPVASNLMLDASGCDIINTSVNGSLAGGVIGFANAKVAVRACSFTGAVSASSRYSGGLLGSTSNYESTISDCHVYEGTITGNDRVGGAIGLIHKKVSVSNCSVGSPEKYIEINGTTINIGGFAGVNYGTISNTTAYATVASSNTNAETAINLGGFVGYHTGTIKENCISHTLIGTSKAAQIGTCIGGFAGTVLETGAVTSCDSFGDVHGTGTIGGFFGELKAASTISNNKSHCTVTGSSTYVGGFAGRIAGAVSCSKCQHQEGKVSSTIGESKASYVGGFAGYIGNTGEAFTGTISECFVNSAVVESIKYSETGSAASSGGWVGGFAGGIGSSTYANNTGIVEKCGVYNKDKSGGTYTGGFAGVSYSKIEKCRVNGQFTITGYADSIGGFCGYQQGNSVKYCYSNAKIRQNNKKNVGGLIGNARNTAVEECYSVGDITPSGSSSSNQGTWGGMIGIRNTVTITKLIRWNNSNSTNIVGGESSTQSGCHVKTSTDTNFQTIASQLGWSTDGTIWTYPNDGGNPVLLGVE